MDRLPQHKRIALVTGGSRGIGFAIARSLTAAGASVVIAGRDEAAIDRAVSDLPAGLSYGLRADVGDPAQAARAVLGAVERFGGLDILVNNAGVGAFGNVADMPVETWQQVLHTNLSGVFYCCREAVPRLRERGGGWIINISSLAAKNPFSGGAAYCASKAALNAFSEALMQEVRYDNIRVSTVMPGSVSTGFGGRGAHGEADWKLAPEDVAEAVVDLLGHPPRSHPSRVELRPSRPPKR
jgi:NAD(P)-dependent dehydrogenase (short-subunit alcohol dehydrogenase family)